MLRWREFDLKLCLGSKKNVPDCTQKFRVGQHPPSMWKYRSGTTLCWAISWHSCSNWCPGWEYPSHCLWAPSLLKNCLHQGHIDGFIRIKFFIIQLQHVICNSSRWCIKHAHFYTRVVKKCWGLTLVGVAIFAAGTSGQIAVAMGWYFDGIGDTLMGFVIAVEVHEPPTHILINLLSCKWHGQKLLGLSVFYSAGYSVQLVICHRLTGRW